MSRLRMAVIGVGHLGRVHARLLRQFEGVELIGVVDPAEEQRNTVAREIGVPSFADYREILGQVDAAVLASPTCTHHAIGLDCLAAGLHLFIEKPLAVTAREGAELVHLARQQGRVLQVGHVERFNPAFVAVQQHVHGTRFIDASRLGTFAGRSTDIGVVLDLMIHDIELALALIRARPTKVDALGLAILGQHEDVANARVTFENGAVAVFSASRVSLKSERRMGVWSAAGFASMDFAARTASLVRISERIRRRQVNVDDLLPAERLCIKDRLFDELLPVEPLAVEDHDPLTNELADFVESIRRARAPKVSGEQGQAALELAEQVLIAIERHSWDGKGEGSHGAHLFPPPRVIPVPHFQARPAGTPHPYREAG